MEEKYDLIVVGGGHAGIEAAFAGARLKLSTLLLTMNVDQIGAMSCNPAIGGVAKGHVVREIDALGGLMGRLIDRSGIQFRELNRSKGPAVRAYRAQADRTRYRRFARLELESTPLLAIRQGELARLILKGERITGLYTTVGERFFSDAVILSAGTFLNGLIHIGQTNFAAGRAGDPASVGLTRQLASIGFSSGRLKTGTCPRLDGATIDFAQTEEQPGDEPTPKFSFYGSSRGKNLRSCYLTATNETTHQIIAADFDRSPLFTGRIKGVGPRYCPSIEDKVHKFPEKDSHHIFLEPEGLDTNEFYPSGLSTSMPIETQKRFLRSIAGLENVRITRPGYAIEYDYFDPTQLYPTLETKLIEGLYFAGQINGTSGYEEAAAQGLLAGINATLKARAEPSLILTRSSSYIGVMIDDLVTKGVDEPYRLFTSRAEFRLLLRQDNADMRLSQIGGSIGLLSSSDYEKFKNKRARIEKELQLLEKIRVRHPAGENAKDGAISAKHFLRRPEVTLRSIPGYEPSSDLTEDELAAIEIESRYGGYIERQERLVERARSGERTRIPVGFDYRLVEGLSTEGRAKLERIRPVDLAQAARIPGVTSAAISVLQVYLSSTYRRAAENFGAVGRSHREEIDCADGVDGA